jgi:hypothetical protein
MNYLYVLDDYRLYLDKKIIMALLMEPGAELLEKGSGFH